MNRQRILAIRASQMSKIYVKGGGLVLVAQVQGSGAGRPWDGAANPSLPYFGNGDPTSQASFITFDISSYPTGKLLQVKWISGLCNHFNGNISPSVASDGGTPYATGLSAFGTGASGSPGQYIGNTIGIHYSGPSASQPTDGVGLMGCFNSYVGGNAAAASDSTAVIGTPFSIGLDSGILVKPAGATGLRIGFTNFASSASYADHPFVMGLYA